LASVCELCGTQRDLFAVARASGSSPTASSGQAWPTAVIEVVGSDDEVAGTIREYQQIEADGPTRKKSDVYLQGARLKELFCREVKPGLFVCMICGRHQNFARLMVTHMQLIHAKSREIRAFKLQLAAEAALRAASDSSETAEEKTSREKAEVEQLDAILLSGRAEVVDSDDETDPVFEDTELEICLDKIFQKNLHTEKAKTFKDIAIAESPRHSKDIVASNVQRLTSSKVKAIKSFLPIGQGKAKKDRAARDSPDSDHNVECDDDKGTWGGTKSSEKLPARRRPRREAAAQADKRRRVAEESATDTTSFLDQREAALDRARSRADQHRRAAAAAGEAAAQAAGVAAAEDPSDYERLREENIRCVRFMGSRGLLFVIPHFSFPPLTHTPTPFPNPTFPSSGKIKKK
jgi:hypothetical protein